MIIIIVINGEVAVDSSSLQADSQANLVGGHCCWVCIYQVNHRIDAVVTVSLW